MASQRKPRRCHRGGSLFICFANIEKDNIICCFGSEITFALLPNDSVLGEDSLTRSAGCGNGEVATGEASHSGESGLIHLPPLGSTGFCFAFEDFESLKALKFLISALLGFLLAVELLGEPLHARLRLSHLPLLLDLVTLLGARKEMKRKEKKEKKRKEKKRKEKKRKEKNKMLISTDRESGLAAALAHGKEGNEEGSGQNGEVSLLFVQRTNSILSDYRDSINRNYLIYFD